MRVLRFRLMGMPVTVRASFLVIVALIGLFGVESPAETVAWILIVFVSILIHEMGHALTARGLGATVAIELNGFGGLTRWNPPEGEVTAGQRALIAAAGSATGLAFGGLVWVLTQPLAPSESLLGFIVDRTVYVNVFWGLLNWLPIRPLDGGHLLMSLLERIAPTRAALIARVIFTVTAGIALVYAFNTGYLYVAVLAAWLLMSELTVGRPTTRTQVPRGLPTLSYDEEAADGVFRDPEPDPDQTEESGQPPE